MLPQLTAQYASASIDDAVIAGVYARIYTAFRRRRSPLLLNLEHQVRFEELPVAGGRFSPAGIADGGLGRRLLGWSVGQHWLLAPVAGTAWWTETAEP